MTLGRRSFESKSQGLSTFSCLVSLPRGTQGGGPSSAPSGPESNGIDRQGLDSHGLDSQGLETRGLETRGLDSRGLDRQG